MSFGEAKLIRLTPMCDNKPKATEKPPFKAGSGLNALAKYTSIIPILCPGVNILW